MRVFISIELPEQVKKEIFNEFKKLENSGFIAGNFVAKNNIHLTLKFLGNLSGEEVDKVKKKLSEIEFKNFKLKTGEIGFFPSENYIRIIWLGLEAEECVKLKEIIEDKLNEIGINREKREFNCHITVVRIKKVKDKENFLKKIKELHVKKMNFDADEFSLIKSELTRNGPIYKILNEFKLKD